MILARLAAPMAVRNRGWRNMRFEVEVYQNDVGEWIATAVEYDVTATGRTEKESLAILMNSLTTHITKGGGKKVRPDQPEG
jgi:hypothetical protein